MTFNEDKTRKTLGNIIFLVRWVLYPINLGLSAALILYVLQFLHDDFHFITSSLLAWWRGAEGHEDALESMMVIMLGFVDASMVANLIIMIVQSGHEIFIRRFEEIEQEDRPQYLAHMDTGIMKAKVALSISSITLVQILKDFVNLEHIDWTLAVHRMAIHVTALLSALMMSIIWRVMHPSQPVHVSTASHGEHK